MYDSKVFENDHMIHSMKLPYCNLKGIIAFNTYYDSLGDHCFANYNIFNLLANTYHSYSIAQSFQSWIWTSSWFPYWSIPYRISYICSFLVYSGIIDSKTARSWSRLWRAFSQWIYRLRTWCRLLYPARIHFWFERDCRWLGRRFMCMPILYFLLLHIFFVGSGRSCRRLSKVDSRIRGCHQNSTV